MASAVNALADVDEAIERAKDEPSFRGHAGLQARRTKLVAEIEKLRGRDLFNGKEAAGG